MGKAAAAPSEGKAAAPEDGKAAAAAHGEVIAHAQRRAPPGLTRPRHARAQSKRRYRPRDTGAFPCPFYSKRHSRTDNLQRHAMDMHKEEIFTELGGTGNECPFCQAVFPLQQVTGGKDVTQHVVKHHEKEMKDLVSKKIGAQTKNKEKDTPAAAVASRPSPPPQVRGLPTRARRSRAR